MKKVFDLTFFKHDCALFSSKVRYNLQIIFFGA